jgi:hypothetical protein
MVQIAFWGSFGEGKRVDLRGRTAGTGARGRKRAKRRGKAGERDIMGRKETNIIKNEAKRGSDGWIRLILGLILSDRGVGMALRRGLTQENHRQIDQNPGKSSILDYLEAVPRGSQGSK